MAHRSRAHLVIDSEKQARNKRMGWLHNQKAQRDSEVQAGEQKAKDAAATDGRAADDLGISLTSDTIIQRLTRLSNQLVIKPGNFGTIAVMVVDPRVPSGLRFLGAFERGVNTEFAKKEHNPDGTLKRVIPGWRRMVMRLIRERLVTEPAANTLFGPPSRQSAAWVKFTT